MRPRAALLVAVAICAGSAVPAQAATPDPVEVARQGDDVRLLAGDEKRELCIGFPDEFDTACAEPGDSVATFTSLGPGEGYLGAAVPAAAATIEVRRAGVLLGSAPTVAGEAYKGVRAGSVRFALVRLAKTDRTDGLRVRALTASGALLEVLATEDDEELVVSRRRLRSGRARGVRWSLVVEETSALAPSVLDLARESVERCVVLVLNTVQWGSACAGAGPVQSPDFERKTALSAETCNPASRVVFGVVDGAAGSVVVALGDGRSRTVATVPVGDGRRAYAIATGGHAIRAVTVPGQGVARPGFAPMSAVCAEGGSGLRLLDFGSSALGILALLFDVPPVTPTGPVTAIAGSPPIQVADGPGDTLCVAIAGKPFDALGCGIVGPRAGLGAFDSFVDPHAFVLAVPARVAAIRIGTADGKVVRTVPTVAGAGYRGRYAGAVRFASAAIAGYADFGRYEYLDAAGTVVHSENQDEGDELVLPRIGAARRLAGREGRPSLWQTNARYGKLVDRCLALTDGPAPTPRANCQTSRAAETVLLDASCATKRLSAGIAVRPGTRVVADTGGKFRRAVRLRRGVGVLTLPAGRPLRALTFIRGSRKRRVEIGAPPGARQCGWHLAPAVDEL